METERPSYVSMSRLRVDPERSAELVEAFRNRMHLVDDVAGFFGLQVWRSDRDSGEVIMVSHWSDRAAFKRYMKSAEHAQSHERVAPDLRDSIKLERLEHLSTFDIVAE